MQANRPHISGQDDAGLRIALCLLACTLGILGRALSGWQAPLWFDEGFSAVIASQQNLHDLIAWCMDELSGPAYYSILWAWEKVAGNSNLALRMPSLLFSCLGPAILAFRGHRDASIRYYWAIIAFLWIPGFTMASDARPYSLVFFLACLQAIAFLRMLEQPNIRQTLYWSVATMLAILTHYHCLIISGIQGLLFLGIHRQKALKCWPALISFSPALAWMSIHLPKVLGYATSGSTWYEVLPPQAALVAPFILFGDQLPGVLMLSGMAAILLTFWLNRHKYDFRLSITSPEAALLLSGALAFIIIFGMGFFRPSFSPRYVTSALPAIIFGIALWMREARKYLRSADLFILAIFIGLSLSYVKNRIIEPENDGRNAFNLEQPSLWLLAQGPMQHMLYLWDNPTGDISKMDRIAEPAGFFLHRAGSPTLVTTVQMGRNENPNLILLRQADARHSDALLWVYDISVPQTRGIRFPARIDQVDPRWRCKDFGGGDIHVTACRKRR